MKRYIPAFAALLVLCCVFGAAAFYWQSQNNLSASVHAAPSQERAASNHITGQAQQTSEVCEAEEKNEVFVPDIDYDKEYIVIDPLLPIGDSAEQAAFPPADGNDLPVTGSRHLARNLALFAFGAAFAAAVLLKGRRHTLEEML